MRCSREEFGHRADAAAWSRPHRQRSFKVAAVDPSGLWRATRARLHVAEGAHPVGLLVPPRLHLRESAGHDDGGSAGDALARKIVEAASDFRRLDRETACVAQHVEAGCSATAVLLRETRSAETRALVAISQKPAISIRSSRVPGSTQILYIVALDHGSSAHRRCDALGIDRARGR